MYYYAFLYTAYYSEWQKEAGHLSSMENKKLCRSSSLLRRENKKKCFQTVSAFTVLDDAQAQVWKYEKWIKS